MYTTPKSLNDVADELVQAFRYGAERDEPEGTRYIKLSETLANKISCDYRDYAKLLENSSRWTC